LKLVIEGISKRYKDKWAVRNFSVELTSGVYGLLGPNGSGKTTLLRMMVDILKPTNGRILLDGRDIQVLDDRYRDLLGYLPQEFGLYTNFTAHRFLMYIAALKGIERDQAEQRVDDVLQLVNLQEERKRKIGTFSGGMKQRLGIAQAILNDPHILILDEPTAGLDPKERIRFRNLISEISGDRIVVFSTHIVSDIEYIAREVMLIKEGFLLKKDTPTKILQELEGKVWQVEIPESALYDIKQKYKMGNIRRKQEGIEVRIISKEKPFPSAVQIEPGMEDIYLYYFDEEAETNGTLETRAV
jgi:ABC-2 type transport system ATP-binding protein